MQGGAHVSGLSPTWSNGLLRALLEKEGQLLVLSIIPRNEALAIQEFVGGTEYIDVREVDELDSLVMYSQSARAFKNVAGAVDIDMHPRRRRAAACIPVSRAAGARRAAATSAATKLTTLGVVLVIGVAVLGGVSAGVVISFGPYREQVSKQRAQCIDWNSSAGLMIVTIWALMWPILQLKTLVQCEVLY